ncbi:hypothetical protein [Marivirga arenosa]|uniref:DUF115 domain-containing protein n=1 Tax=Marivirga arenosa TaxID=3059076 RepID=A0AA51X401_9BACT|nr:hypothetical protein [Marivirga sp. BKB1-2]WNB17271.1 hypothetical protein QYS47_33440 [Marivirga sp. BKB1-2]
MVKLRDFILEVGGIFLSIIKIIFMSRVPFNSKLEKKPGKSLVLLGNGPSLNDTLKQKDFFEDKDLLCVNYFCRTEEFQELKPSYYVITSLEYFFNEEKEHFAIERRRTLESIAKNTHWPMIFFIPAKAKSQQEWKSIFKDNKYISIYYFNTTPISGLSFFTNFCFSNNLGMPRPHNVLIPAMMLGIRMRYEYLYVAGADHSWLKEIYVDSDNEVLLSQKHFYDNQAKKQEHYRDMSVAQPMYHGGSAATRKLHEVIEKFYYTFRSYWKIKSYAEDKSVNIYNITPESYIDAFDRIDITQKKQS